MTEMSLAEINHFPVNLETGEILSEEINTLALIENAWKSLAQASSLKEIKGLRDFGFAVDKLARKRDMSREAQNEAAKIHLAASIRLGEVVKGQEKAGGTRGVIQLGMDGAGGCKLQPPAETPTYSDLGLEKTDAFRVQRLYDWEKQTAGASKAVQELEENQKELTVSKLITQAVKYFKIEKRIADIEEQAEKIKQESPEIPVGPFHVISIDPPWPYGTEYDPNGRRAANPYPEMSLEEIKALQLPSADDCVLWLWTTHKFMRYSFELLDAWNFRDVAILTWVKDRMGLGSWLRSQSEFCIMAIKGNPPVRLTNQTTILQGPLREHSRKPDSFYDLVNSLCVGAKLDYFSREKRDGWEQVGNTPELFDEDAR